jgi:hypothetical protein
VRPGRQHCTGQCPDMITGTASVHGGVQSRSLPRRQMGGAWTRNRGAHPLDSPGGCGLLHRLGAPGGDPVSRAGRPGRATSPSPPAAHLPYETAIGAPINADGPSSFGQARSHHGAVHPGRSTWLPLAVHLRAHRQVRKIITPVDAQGRHTRMACIHPFGSRFPRGDNAIG